MSSPRTAAAVLTLTAVPLGLSGVTAAPAAAHGSMTDPVSRVSACHAEGPESPDSAACAAAVAAGGTQPFYDWNEVNIPDAAGRHREIVPDGRLCGAGRDKYRGLDLARADWPASPMAAGKHTFRYRATAPHRGSIALYLTKEGYDAAKPLTWADLEAEPFVKVTDPKLVDGSYVFDGTVPARSGRHLVYSVWQRSDSPEAFYTCSDVVFGGGVPTGPTASAPSERRIADDAARSTVSHGGHGGDGGHGDGGHGHAGGDGHGGTHPTPAPDGGTRPAGQAEASPVPVATASPAAAAPGAAGGPHLATTGGDGTAVYLAAGGAVALGAGAVLLLRAARRRSA
ncbi:lytic polysaccharide monooxygenase [Streptomyces sp. DH12]|uniref:lytic polysaccharide monooxygenase auxiliary activity family 9 protein n=1 Tax=Streptomyces sp. DH12 TaxID=2857010 RepID=UPI001E65BD68|nr:lytic polysaccharide monooxygenase [Streptomyces sp. DH12]